MICQLNCQGWKTLVRLLQKFENIHFHIHKNIALKFLFNNDRNHNGKDPVLCIGILINVANAKLLCLFYMLEILFFLITCRVGLHSTSLGIFLAKIEGIVIHAGNKGSLIKIDSYTVNAVITVYRRIKRVQHGRLRIIKIGRNGNISYPRLKSSRSHHLGGNGISIPIHNVPDIGGRCPYLFLGFISRHNALSDGFRNHLILVKNIFNIIDGHMGFIHHIAVNGLFHTALTNIN